MEKDRAKKILTKSIANLHKYKGEVTNMDIEAEVINNACLIFLKGQKDSLNDTGNLQDQLLSILDSQTSLMPIATAFTQGAHELFPDSYSTKHAISATMGIQNNVAWEGMWDFLRDYFESNHGIQIDAIPQTTKVLDSNLHKRYEAGSFISESDAIRRVQINFINDEEIMVEIADSLSPKKAYLESESGHVKIFKGYDPDYLFEVKFDEFEEIQEFVLKLPQRQLKIEYFE